MDSVASSLDEELPERHLPRFGLEVIHKPDISSVTHAHRESGSAPCHPAMFLALLVYGYATGAFFRRKIKRATHDSVALCPIASAGDAGLGYVANVRSQSS